MEDNTRNELIGYINEDIRKVSVSILAKIYKYLRAAISGQHNHPDTEAEINNVFFRLGDYVVDIKDVKNSDPAIIVYDHKWAGHPNLFTIKRADGHISLRKANELWHCPVLDFMKIWCNSQIGYKGHG